MKKFTIFALCMLLIVSLFAGCNKTTPVHTTSGTATSGGTGDEAGTAARLTGLHYVEIEVADYGTITCELDADTAPITVTNFMKLVESGFYDGLTFHRVDSGFMIQGGDPSGDGTGGSADKIKGEFSGNGVANDISHVRGVLSMARASNPNSASCQFFIVHEDSTFLDGQYAAFGRVTEGMEVVDAICEASANWEMDSMNVLTNAEQQPVITAIRAIEANS